MEEMASLWSYQETMEELKQNLLYSTFELESVKAESSEEMRKSKEYVKELVHLLKIACKERDEARNQLQKLLEAGNVSIDKSFVMIPYGTKANSGVTESNSLSQGSLSPVESFLDAVDSSTMMPVVDKATVAIESLVKGKSLPQKGKFLQAVLEAGPLLQTLLVAGPLPRWRNPPQLKPFHIPPVSIRGCNNNAEILTHHSQLCFEIPGSSSSQMLLNFGSCLGSQRLMSSADSSVIGNGYFHLEKRQRLQ